MSVEQVEETRFVVLMAGRDGENFLHRDQSDHPCQAVVMLSDPCVDYSGGATYIQDANNLYGTREEVCMSSMVSFYLQPSCLCMWLHIHTTAFFRLGGIYIHG